MEDIIRVQNLCKDYYQYKVFKKGKLLTKALQNVSFTVKEGSFFGLLGQNGAGKSTLLRILTTNLKKSYGDVWINNINLDDNIRKIKQDISWMFGIDYEGFGWSSIEKNLMLAAAFLGLDKYQAERRVRTLLEYFDLYKDRKLDVWRMSAGMQAKYSLAASMLKQPKLLFLDEPLLGLDVPAKDMLRKILQELNKDGTTIVYTDHQLHEMEKVCKDIIIIEQGTKVYDGNVDDLKQKHRDTHVLELTCAGKAINKALLKLVRETRYVKDYDIINSTSNKHDIKIYTTTDSTDALLKVGNYLKRQKVVIEKLNAGLLSLEDVYKKFLTPKTHDIHVRTLQGFRTAGEQPLAHHSRYLQHKHAAVRGEACLTFMDKKPKDVHKLLKRMGKMSKPMQLSCLRVIQHTKAHELFHTLQKTFNNKDQEIKLAVLLTKATLGDTRIVRKLLDYLLEESTIQTILERAPHFHPQVLQQLAEDINELSRHDKHFITYHIEHSKHQHAITNALHLQHHSYKAWKQHKKKALGKIK